MPRKVVGGGHVGQNEPLAALVFGLPNCPTIFPPKTVFFRFKRKIEKKISAIRAQSKNMERKIVKKQLSQNFSGRLTPKIGRVASFSRKATVAKRLHA